MHENQSQSGGGCLWPSSWMTVDFLAAIIDHVAHPIFVKDREFRFVLVNRALCDLVGYAREEMLGKTDYDFFPAEEADFFRRKDQEMFSTGAKVSIEEEPITDAAGSRHVLATTKVPLRDGDGRVTFLVGIIHDITRLKDVEDALRQANEQLEERVAERTRALEEAQQELLRKERLAVLGRLSGGLAHQIRNPLGSISTGAYVLRRLLVEDPRPEVGEALDAIVEDTERANRIVTDLLDYARVRPAVAAPTPVAVLVDQALAVEHMGDAVQVVREIGDVPRVAVDAEQVRGALSNLIRNAVEAMPGGGTLTVTARLEGGEVVLTVRDTGEGIPGNVQARLFEPLVTSKPHGLGLGLTTARSLIENQGGTIACASREGEGTRFDVRLPVARAAA